MKLDAKAAERALFGDEGPAERVRLAASGSIFLEDVDRLPGELQRRLSSVLQRAVQETAGLRVLTSVTDVVGWYLFNGLPSDADGKPGDYRTVVDTSTAAGGLSARYDLDGSGTTDIIYLHPTSLTNRHGLTMQATDND